MPNRISVLIDATVDKAVGAIGNFKAALNDAETNGTSKFKAGATSAFDSVKQNAGALALAGGTALAGFAISAVHAFEDTAKAALDLGASTGLAVEDASRWIAVGDDFGIGADALQGGIGKIAKSLDDTKWADYGIRTRDAAGEARDANDILIDSLATLSSITSETERAKAGNELFGKGYQNLAPMIGHTREEYEQMLGAVEDGQVITAGEAKKAEAMRLAEDALADALKEVQLAVGQVVAGLAPYIQKLSEIVGLLVKIPALQDLAFGGMPTDVGSASDSFMKLAKEAEASGDAIGYLTGKGLGIQNATDLMARYEESVAATTPTTDKASTAAENLATELAALGVNTDDYRGSAHDAAFETSQAGRTMEVYEDAARNAAGAIAEAEAATKALTDEYDRMLGRFDEEKSWLTLEEHVRQFTFDMASGKLSVDEKRLALVNLQAEMTNYVKGLEGIPASKVTDILALIDQGKLDEANRLIAELTRPRDVQINAHYTGLADVNTGQPRDSHGGGAGFNVAEAGAGAVFTPAAAASNGGNTYITVNTSAEPQAVVAAIKQYAKQNGNGAIASAIGLG